MYRAFLGDAFYESGRRLPAPDVVFFRSLLIPGWGQASLHSMRASVAWLAGAVVAWGTLLALDGWLSFLVVLGLPVMLVYHLACATSARAWSRKLEGYPEAYRPPSATTYTTLYSDTAVSETVIDPGAPGPRADSAPRRGDRG